GISALQSIRNLCMPRRFSARDLSCFSCVSWTVHETREKHEKSTGRRLRRQKKLTQRRKDAKVLMSPKLTRAAVVDYRAIVFDFFASLRLCVRPLFSLLIAAEAWSKSSALSAFHLLFVSFAFCTTTNLTNYTSPCRSPSSEWDYGSTSITKLCL